MNSTQIITRDSPWQQQLRQAITDPAELLRRLQLPAALLPAAEQAAAQFALRVPEAYLSRIEPGNPQDPLLLQVLPLAAELRQMPGYVTDPLAEAEARAQDGLIHKYRGRVLLIMTGACAINCRYCFRRHFPYQENRLGPQQWQQVLDYIRQDSEITEVILSGGDPLAVPDSRLAKLVQDLEQIPQLQRLRIHTRLPLVIPQRVTDELTELLANSRLQTVMVLHSNHAREVDQAVIEAIRRLRRAGVSLLNQAVLLKGINDTVATQKALHETLFAAGVLPYYLFVLDPVAGAAHFDLSDSDAQRLMSQLQAVLPGYLVPRLAREIPGRGAKTLLPVQSPAAP